MFLSSSGNNPDVQALTFCPLTAYFLYDHQEVMIWCCLTKKKKAKVNIFFSFFPIYMHIALLPNLYLNCREHLSASHLSFLTTNKRWHAFNIVDRQDCKNPFYSMSHWGQWATKSVLSWTKEMNVFFSTSYFRKESNYSLSSSFCPKANKT